MAAHACTWSSRDGSAKIKRAQAEALVVKQAAEIFQMRKNACPKDAAQLSAEGFLPPTYNDPWGHPYVVTCSAEKEASTIAAFSKGPDQIPGTPDDIHSTP